MPNDFTYHGTELDAFSRAKHWKAYWGGIVSQYLGSRVLEVGAGTGATVRLLLGTHQTKWLALEPDARLAEQIRHDRSMVVPGALEIRVGTLADVTSAELFDTVLYIDVLEHIEDDRGELEQASRHLADGGYIVVLAPAHQKLFTTFDAAIGHYRRYSRKELLNIGPPGLKPHYAIYLDSVGLLASLGNRFVLKSSAPTSQQIQLWDNWIVPASRFLDPITRYRMGKSVLVVWRKEGIIANA